MATHESYHISGENLVKKVKELIDQGNVRRVTIKDKHGKEFMSFPLTVGVIGALLAPIIAAVGAVAALVGECTVAVEREDLQQPNTTTDAS
ncbi:DUF4342 domain-containing protein [Polluticoccus soli]|uniref:DUF4342 domain-containing protein n=1 Tax=Polluticoccus soli TaxID=3034150 RepID=UPI0023E16125|nr:DUF4342 domain-containing protein [Flavipsychrobacter sp. JY13-12]